MKLQNIKTTTLRRGIWINMVRIMITHKQQNGMSDCLESAKKILREKYNDTN